MRYLSILALVVVTACGHKIQTSSGESYLAAYSGVLDTPPETRAVSVSTSNGEITGKELPPSDAELIRAAASVEPILRFPARFGLAKLVNGRLHTIDEDEADLWAEFAKKHAHFGTFAQVSPVLTEFTSATVQQRFSPEHRVSNVVSKIRLGAARQHLDAVLVYEVGLRSGKNNTGLAFADMTILGGAILPTRKLKASGKANALLVDVRNGYPYGTATAQTDLSKLSTSWGSDMRRADLREQARHEVTADLIPEVSAMLAELAMELAEKRQSPGS